MINHLYVPLLPHVQYKKYEQMLLQNYTKTLYSVNTNTVQTCATYVTQAYSLFHSIGFTRM